MGSRTGKRLVQVVERDGNARVGNGDKHNRAGRLALLLLLLLGRVDLERLVVAVIDLDGAAANDGVLHGRLVVAGQSEKRDVWMRRSLN